MYNIVVEHQTEQIETDILWTSMQLGMFVYRNERIALKMSYKIERSKNSRARRSYSQCLLSTTSTLHTYI